MKWKDFDYDNPPSGICWVYYEHPEYNVDCKNLETKCDIDLVDMGWVNSLTDLMVILPSGSVIKKYIKVERPEMPKD